MTARQGAPLVAVLAALAAALAPPGPAAAADPEPPPPANEADEADEKPHHRFGLPAPRPRAPGAIRLVSYNLLNLFDPEDDPALDDPFDDLPQRTSDARCRALAAAIRATDADILCLQEVESLAALRWFRDTYLAGAGYDHLASRDVGHARGIECSVMSRFAITAVEAWPNEPLDDVERPGAGWARVPERDEPLTYQRSPLMVDVRVDDDYELTLFVVHHKSGRSFRYHREAEALRTMEKVRRRLAETPDRNVLVVGDFNAAPWDRSLRVYLEGGLIDTLAHRTTFRRAPEAPLYMTHESHRVLDYVLLNSAAHRELVIGSPHVFGTLYDESYDWRRDPFPPGYASDHYPVIIDLVPRDRP